MKYLILIVLILLPIHSCSTFKEMGQNLTHEGHFRLYTYPEKIHRYLELEKYQEEKETFDDKKPRYKDIILVGINNLHARLEPLSTDYLDRAQNTSFQINRGGIAGYKAYFDILRSKLKDQVQFIASGSMFDASVPAEKVIFYLNYLNIDVLSLGVNDFNYSYTTNYLNRLDYKMKKAKFVPLISNVFDLSKNETKEFKYIQQSHIVETNGIKVGHIGLISPKAIQKIPSKKLTGTYFEKLPIKMISHAIELRRKGADIITVLVNDGLDCTSQQSQEMNIDEYKVNFLPENESLCDTYENSLALALKQLPPNTIDVVFMSGANSKVANYINGIPVLQNYANGTDFSWIKLTFDLKHQRVVKEKTQILQPVSTCHQFF
jgi:2',3'-cyclic-nucleotide 2'-phosphodiesterase (5'-nucleotidase family)